MGERSPSAVLHGNIRGAMYFDSLP
jgi:hypothetical protein